MLSKNWVIPCLGLVLAGGAVALNGAEKESRHELILEASNDQVTVRIGGEIFTEYVFGDDLKYPQFYPVNGPTSGRSVTERRLDPYPHHSSLFFACDKVNGGNYWQEGLERGRIISQKIRVLEEAGAEVIFEQETRWERPGAEAPFSDRRVIAIQAPSPQLRIIDFTITLTALTEVKIEKNNHSLFSARMAPDLAVSGGGEMINSNGESGEKETFGKKAEWMGVRGPRDGTTEGLVILVHPENRWSPSPWFTRDYGFFSPTPINWITEPLRMEPEEELHLRYRVLVHSGDLEPAEIDLHFRHWTEGK